MTLDISKLRYWIFDMDGTLTVPLHDFEAIRIELGLPGVTDILAAIEAKPADEAKKIHRKLAEIELRVAKETKAQPGVHDFIEQLVARGFPVGIITRNNLHNTDVTLEVMNMKQFFPDSEILTREFTPAKPHPDPVLYFINRWNANKDETVIIGDYKHDLESGNAAGIHTIYFDSRKIGQWNHMAELTVARWDELQKQL